VTRRPIGVLHNFNVDDVYFRYLQVLHAASGGSEC
jgi:hypothetical protein